MDRLTGRSRRIQRQDEDGDGDEDRDEDEDGVSGLKTKLIPAASLTAFFTAMAGWGILALATSAACRTDVALTVGSVPLATSS